MRGDRGHEGGEGVGGERRDGSGRSVGVEAGTGRGEGEEGERNEVADGLVGGIGPYERGSRSNGKEARGGEDEK